MSGIILKRTETTAENRKDFGELLFLILNGDIDYNEVKHIFERNINNGSDDEEDENE